jgi:hypothetical protein
MAWYFTLPFTICGDQYMWLDAHKVTHPENSQQKKTKSPDARNGNGGDHSPSSPAALIGTADRSLSSRLHRVNLK